MFIRYPAPLRITALTLGLLTSLCLVRSIDAQEARSQNPLEQFPKVVAVVNGQTITREKLAQDCLKRYGTVVLDNLLNKHLILQACQAKGITITQQNVNDEINPGRWQGGFDQQAILGGASERTRY